MKYLSYLLVLIMMLSCKESENSIENILLNKLKQSSGENESLSNSLIDYYIVKYSESGEKDEDFNFIKEYKIKLDKFLIEIKSENKENQIIKYDQFTKERNFINLYIPFKLDKSNLENLSNETTYYFLKDHLYKNLYSLLQKKKSNVINCGYTRYSDEKTKLMDKLKSMKVQEFKDSICNSN
ncbi:hypothetical protein G6N05_12755 [Flavobacterium sp. F372]|uniref:Lipoprotein n=1 Tax=Flavobacterium bernardetii TaxID=2813823 RepID=A0ABR7J0Q9_9FLAO|nr:hypothetical protein [Flavobacterium bernardetii]MBC5835618.1 hypothetical protein [Flavobacterium bernardetii]NHF70982.1 hypothetical protein [Flavobacterium bernardetii]